MGNASPFEKPDKVCAIFIALFIVSICGFEQWKYGRFVFIPIHSILVGVSCERVEVYYELETIHDHTRQI